MQPDNKPLVDIRTVSVGDNLPPWERKTEYVRQIIDPYHFKCGKFTITASFMPDGPTLEDRLRGMVL